MDSNDAWADFENLRHTVNHNTVDKLKQILTGFNEQCKTSIPKSGKKQDLITRIIDQMATWRRENNVERWTTAQAILRSVRYSGIYSMRGPGTSGQQPGQSMPPYEHITIRNGVSSNPPGRYDPYAPPPQVPPPPIGASSSSIPKPQIQFKPSPFFRIDQPVSGIAECPESSSSTDRKQQTLTFTLTSEHTAKLAQTNSRYQLRLYCTTSTFYSHSTFRPSGPCPIEFPPTCEVRVNGVALQANLKGLKKKPGTAPPADLGKATRLSGQNRVEMVYVNSQQPVQPKKFYLIVFLVEVTSVAQLVDKLKKGKYRSCEDILQQIKKKSASDDDEIVAGPQKMSLKCPLSFMRIETPSRSVHCVHLQCFDATSWFSCMEQTTTWLCPVCEKVLNPDDLIVDGYFHRILQATPDDVDDVMIENDGEWHSADNKYGSAAWQDAFPYTGDPEPSPHPSSPASDEESESKALAGDVEVLVLDSDDEDEGRVKRELSVSQGSIAPPMPNVASPRGAPMLSRQTRQDDVIDLTADSDEETSYTVTRAGEKRKQPSGTQSPTEQIWKKSRPDSVLPHLQAGPRSGSRSGSSTSQLSPVSPTTGTALPRGPSFGGSTNSYPGPSLPPFCLPRTPSTSLPGKEFNLTFVPPPPPAYRSPIVPPGPPREPVRRPYDPYSGNSGTYYSSHAGGSTSRPGVWP